MKNNFKIFFLLSSCFLFSKGLLAQLNDVYSGRSIELANYVIDFTPKLKFAKGEIDLTCMHIKDETEPMIKTVNTRVLELFKSFLTIEENFLPVYRKMEKRIDQYNKLANSRNDGRYRDNSADKLAARLTDVSCEGVALVSDKLFFRIDFLFWLEVGNYNEGIEFNVSEFYHVDLKTSKITHLEFNWNAAQKEMMMAKIKDQLNEDYALFTTHVSLEDMDEIYNDSDYDEEEESEEKKKIVLNPGNKRDVSSQVNLNEADFYWMGWGMMVGFQKFTESSGIYQGNPFEIFIPLDKVKEIMKEVPEFSFVKNLQNPSGNLKDFNYQEVLGQTMDINFPRDISDWVSAYGGETRPKSVKIKHFQIMSDSSVHITGSGKNEFTKDGKLLNKFIYGKEDKIANRTEYVYDKDGKLILKLDYSDNKEEGQSEKYTYDDKGNLVQIIYADGYDVRIVRYFYNGYYIYEMNSHFFKENNESHLRQCYYDGREFRFREQTIILNDKGQAVGVKAEKYIMNQFQIGRDENGRLLEVHRENDRYNRFYKYDSLGRIDEISSFESARLQFKNAYFYEGTYSVPLKMETIRKSGGQETVLKEEYEWEFY